MNRAIQKHIRFVLKEDNEVMSAALTGDLDEENKLMYDGDKKTLMQSLERIQRTAAEILEAVAAEHKERVNTADVPARVAVAA